MIPWPIAVLTLWYGIIATGSAATVWKIGVGVSHQAIFWSLGWWALSGTAAIGLALLTSWGRLAAILTSWLLTVTTLAIAAVFVGSGHPIAGVWAAFATTIHVLMIRYLQRPIVKSYFGTRDAEGSVMSVAPGIER